MPWVLIIKASWSSQPQEKEDDLNATDDGEPSQKTHGASNQTQLGLNLDLLVFFDRVKGCSVKVDLYHLKSWMWQFLAWNIREKLNKLVSHEATLVRNRVNSVKSVKSVKSVSSVNSEKQCQQCQHPNNRDNILPPW